MRPTTRHNPSDVQRDTLVQRLAEIVGRHDEVAAAWLHGSVARGEPAHDVDVALLVRSGSDPWRVADQLAVELEGEAAAGLPYDVRPVSSESPAEFRWSLVHEGIRLVEHDRDARILFECAAFRDYLDMEPLLVRSRRIFRERLAHGG